MTCVHPFQESEISICFNGLCILKITRTTSNLQVVFAALVALVALPGSQASLGVLSQALQVNKHSNGNV